MLHQEVRDGLPVLLCRRWYVHCAGTLQSLPLSSSPQHKQCEGQSRVYYNENDDVSQFVAHPREVTDDL